VLFSVFFNHTAYFKSADGPIFTWDLVDTCSSKSPAVLVWPKNAVLGGDSCMVLTLQHTSILSTQLDKFCYADRFILLLCLPWFSLIPGVTWENNHSP
jgi:hypothetical protein